MDAQIYQFKRHTSIIWPNGDGFVDVVNGAMQFSAWYFGAMISFHSAMAKVAVASLRESFK